MSPRDEANTRLSGFILKHLLRWALLAFALNGLWEAAQLPLYTLWQDPDRQRIVFYALHCVAGDVLISTFLFLFSAAIFKDFAWPSRRPGAGGLAVIAGGLIYTSFSEGYNVYQVRAWAYAGSMPLVFGIGLTPLLQWLVVPVLTIAAFRFRIRD